MLRTTLFQFLFSRGWVIQQQVRTAMILSVSNSLKTTSQLTPQFPIKLGSARAASPTVQHAEATWLPAPLAVRTKPPESHLTSQEIFVWLNAHQATSVVPGINAWSVKALACSATLVPLCVPSAIHRLGLPTLVWRLYSVIARAHLVPIWIQCKVFVWCVSRLVSLAHLPLTVCLVIVQSRITLTSIFLDSTSSATKHVLRFQCRARARYALNVRPLALLALNCQTCARIAQKGCIFTSSNVWKSVLLGSTVMIVCRNARRLQNWTYPSLSQFLRFCFQYSLEFLTFWKVPEVIKRALRFT